MMKVAALPLTVVLCAIAFTSQPLKSQDAKNKKDKKPTCKAVRNCNGEQDVARPACPKAAHARTLQFPTQHGCAAVLHQPNAEIDFARASENDFGLTHVRLDQVRSGVHIFHSQIITLIVVSG